MEKYNLKEEFLFDGNEEGCLLIHGFSSTPAEMRELGERLRCEGYTVLGVKLAGHCTTPENMEKCRYIDWINSVKEGYEKLKKICSRINVIGHSMGGLLAMYVTENYEVNRLIVLAPAVVTRDRMAKLVPIAKYFVRYTEWETVERPKEESKYLLGYSKIPLASVHELNKLQRVVKKNINKICRPILVIQSLRDPAVHERGINIIQNKTASKEIKTIYLSNCGHNITVECEKEKVFYEVIEFLK